MLDKLFPDPIIKGQKSKYQQPEKLYSLPPLYFTSWPLKIY